MAIERRYRHSLSARLWHWLNALCVITLQMSGLMILNAHPRLYWGHYGANLDPAWLDLGSMLPDGRFPGWMTIPSGYSLAIARRWHLAFAMVFAFGLLFLFLRGIFGGQLKRAIGLRWAELAPARLWDAIKHHLRLDFSESGDGYNVLQKITYALVLTILLPGMVLTGLAMSPGMNAAWPWVLDLLGGRQSARSLHFIFASGLAGFLILHVVLVILAGPVRLMRAMITGWSVAEKEDT